MADSQRVKDLIARFDALNDPRVEAEIREASKEFSDNLKAGKCGMCGSTIDILAFRDEPSWREYKLSHMCMICQDKTFNR